MVVPLSVKNSGKRASNSIVGLSMAARIPPLVWRH